MPILMQDNMSAVVVLLDSAPKQGSGFEAPETIPDPNVVYSKENDPVERESQVLGATFFGAMNHLLVR